MKLKRTQHHPHAGTFNINVELGPDDRYLTLVSTDGGDGIDDDCVVIGDPVLEMVPARSEKPAGNENKETTVRETHQASTPENQEP